MGRARRLDGAPSRTTVAFARLPSFSVVAQWSFGANGPAAAKAVRGLADALSRVKLEKVQLVRSAAEVVLHLRLDAPRYPAEAVKAAAKAVEGSRGRWIDLWKLPKPERDAFRTQRLAGEGRRSTEPKDLESAASLVEAAIPSLKEDAPRPAPAPPPAPASGPKRQSERHQVRLEVEFQTELDFVKEHAENISNGGLFVRTELSPEVDSVVEVRVKLPSGQWLSSTARVAHVQGQAERKGVGLQFLSEDPAFQEALDRYLASLA